MAFGYLICIAIGCCEFGMWDV